MALETIDRKFVEPSEDVVWELFHENSKMSWYDSQPLNKRRLSDAAVVRTMKILQPVKQFTDFPKVALPMEFPPARRDFDAVVLNRETARGFGGGEIGLGELAKILHMSYGITRDKTSAGYPRPFRTIPSGGALYPLEIYPYSLRVRGLEPGLYHYNPQDSFLDVLGKPLTQSQLGRFFIQPELALAAAIVVFVTAVFYRTMFKYGDRGYRFVMLEAGHLGQNANLTSQSLGLASANIGGYVDRDVDRYLGLDGLSESTVYALLIGTPEQPAQD